MENECSKENEDGTVSNFCEDMPVTFCPKCRTFYMLDKEGNREEIYQMPEASF